MAKHAARYASPRVSASTCSSQSRMYISRYIVVAVARCSCADSRLAEGVGLAPEPPADLHDSPPGTEHTAFPRLRWFSRSAGTWLRERRPAEQTGQGDRESLPVPCQAISECNRRGIH